MELDSNYKQNVRWSLKSKQTDWEKKTSSFHVHNMCMVCVYTLWVISDKTFKNENTNSVDCSISVSVSPSWMRKDKICLWTASVLRSAMVTFKQSVIVRTLAAIPDQSGMLFISLFLFCFCTLSCNSLKSRFSVRACSAVVVLLYTWNTQSRSIKTIALW